MIMPGVHNVLQHDSGVRQPTTDQRSRQELSTQPLKGLSAEQVRRLSAVAGRIAREQLAPSDAFTHMLELATDLTQTEFGSIHLVDKEQSVLRLAALMGVPDMPVSDSAYPIDASIAGMVVKDKVPMRVTDVNAHSTYVELFPQIRSELAVPILVGEEVVGVINLESAGQDHFTDEHAEVVQLVASLIAAALRSDELTRLREAPIETLGPTGEREVVVVLMPFSEPFNKYYRAIFRPAVEDAGLAALRADEIFGPTEIMHDLWGLVQRARVVLAELTSRNPNVMYEVGLSHGIGKPVVLVAQSMEDVPFDLRALRCVLYDTTEPDWGTTLRGNLAESLRSVLSSGATGPYK